MDIVASLNGDVTCLMVAKKKLMLAFYLQYDNMTLTNFPELKTLINHKPDVFDCLIMMSVVAPVLNKVILHSTASSLVFA